MTSSDPCLAANVSLQHLCSHRCHVQREFGNVFRCMTSGLVHVCDQTCNQRLYNDRYSTICRISKKLHPPFEGEPQQNGMAVDADPPCRKRDPCEEQQQQLDSQAPCKRRQVMQACGQQPA